jgi:hypothetical protein
MTPSEERAGMDNETMRKVVEALKAGWEACRRSVYELAEDTVERTPENANDFQHGRKVEAKSFAKAFSAMNAEDDDHFQAAFAAFTQRAPDAPSSGDIEEIRSRHSTVSAQMPLRSTGVLYSEGREAHADRATLLRLLDAARAELAETGNLLEQCHEFFGEMYVNGVCLPETGEQHLERVSSRVAAALNKD